MTRGERPTGSAGFEVVVLDCGSSSVKGGTRYRVDRDGEARLAEASVESVTSVDKIGDAATRIYVGLAARQPPDAVGHRFAHGGPTLRAPALVDDVVLAELHRAAPIPAFHLVAALAAVEAIRVKAPGIPQVACFDTSFHATLPEAQWRLPVPRALAAEGIRRYGSHGLSYEHVVGIVGAATLGRAVVAHLGNGASLCAIVDGRSVATSMGFTPTGGIPMGTRSGDLDPGVLVHLVRAGYDADRLERLVDRESGLLALGGTSDMAELLERREVGDDDAAFAIDVFCLRVAMEIGAYAALMGSLDTIVFTAGIGERSAAIRAAVCGRLADLGVRVDDERNERNALVISDEGAIVTVRVVPTDEDAVIARHTRELVLG